MHPWNDNTSVVVPLDFELQFIRQILVHTVCHHGEKGNRSKFTLLFTKYFAHCFSFQIKYAAIRCFTSDLTLMFSAFSVAILLSLLNCYLVGI